MGAETGRKGFAPGTALRGPVVRYEPTPLEYAACYAAYAVIAVAAIFGVFVVWRRAILGMLLRLALEPEGVRLWYVLSMLVMGVGLFIGVFAAEAYLRTGLRWRRLRRRLLRLGLPVAGFVLLGLLLRAATPYLL